MKCPKCGYENEGNTCKKCGTKVSSKLKYNKHWIIIGILIILVVAVLAIGAVGLNISGVNGNQSITDISGRSYNNSNNYIYEVSFTLDNVTDFALENFAKVIWYNDEGEEVLTKYISLENYTVTNSQIVNVVVQGESSKDLNINQCVIELLDGKNVELASADYKWESN